MSIISSKWFIALVLIVIVLVVLYVLGHKTVHSERVIPAEPDEIWSVLLDKNSYQEWNPILIPSEGDLREGETLTYKMISPDDKESMVKTKVVHLQKAKLLNQYGGMPGILTFDHRWILEPAPNGTKVIQHEEYRGIGVLFWDPGWVEIAYHKSLEALETRIYSLRK